ncbi:MAG: GNAT family N-acetyltransferase [Chloroflexales bacterium]
MSVLITLPTSLSAEVFHAARALVHECNQAEDLDLPIIPAVDPDSTVLLAHHGDKLVGIAQIDFGPQAEACLCVSPAWRRRGIGRGLAMAVNAHVASRGAGDAVFVSDMAAESGRAFADALGVHLSLAEHRLSLDITAVPPPPAPMPDLYIRLADRADTNSLATVLSAAFGDPLPMMQSFVARRLTHPTNRFIVGLRDQRLVGTLRLVEDNGWIYITTFGVLPELHGRGVGRHLLLHALGQMTAKGMCRIRIDVETTNVSAHGLYKSCGFRHDRTFAYYRLQSMTHSQPGIIASG